MGSSMLLAASRQSFAFARDGALPLSDLLYRINTYTGTPVNTVWFDCAFALLVGLLALLGSAATNSVFAISVAALYVAYIVPIVSRFVFKNDFKPGPFSLGVLVSSAVLDESDADVGGVGCSDCIDGRWVYGDYARHPLFSVHPGPTSGGDELYVGRIGRCDVARDGVVLFPGVWGRALVPWTCV